jgi:hypothetical protein
MINQEYGKGYNYVSQSAINSEDVTLGTLYVEAMHHETVDTMYYYIKCKEQPMRNLAIQYITDMYKRYNANPKTLRFVTRKEFDKIANEKGV